MNWKSIADIVGKSAPILGSLLLGPAGGAAGSLIALALGTSADPNKIAEVLATSSEAGAKLAELEVNQKSRLEELILVAETARMAEVNATMRAEAQADHWPTYSWRPFIGFVTGFMVLGIYFILPLCGMDVPFVPTEVWIMLGTILGVASWFRGKAQADPNVPFSNRG